MTIEFECGNCGKQFSTPDDKAGKTGKCPDCGEPVTVPQPQGSAPEESPFAFDSPGTANETTDTESTSAPSARSVPQTALQTCPMCGAEVAATEAVCSHCGEELRTSTKTSAGERRFSTGHKIEVGPIISSAWERYSAQMGMAIAGLIIGYFASVGLSYAMMFVLVLAVALSEASIALAILTGVVGYLGMLVAQVWLGLGMCKFSLTIARGKEPELTEIFTAGRFIGRGVLCGLLIGLIAMAAVFVMAFAAAAGVEVGEVVGFVVMLLGIGMYIWVVMSFAWTGFVLVDIDAPGISAAFLSRDLMKGNYLAVLLLYLISVLIMFAGMLVCGVGLIFAFPLVMIIFAVTYEHLSGGGPGAARVAAY